MSLPPTFAIEGQAAGHARDLPYLPSRDADDVEPRSVKVRAPVCRGKQCGIEVFDACRARAVAVPPYPRLDIQKALAGDVMRLLLRKTHKRFRVAETLCRVPGGRVIEASACPGGLA
jgi:hypothetical protein